MSILGLCVFWLHHHPPRSPSPLFRAPWLAAGGIPNGFEAPNKTGRDLRSTKEKNKIPPGKFTKIEAKNYGEAQWPWSFQGVDFGVNELFFLYPQQVGLWNLSTPKWRFGSDFLFNWVMFSFKMWIFWGGMVHILQNGFSLTPSNLFLSQSVHPKIWNTMFSYVFQGFPPVPHSFEPRQDISTSSSSWRRTGTARKRCEETVAWKEGTW